MKKRILFVTTKYPYPRISGDRVRAFHLIEQLSTQYEIDLLYLEGSTSHAAQEQISTKKNIYIPSNFFFTLCSWIMAFLRGLPIQVAYYTRPSVRHYIAKHISEYDILYCHLVRTAEYARGVTIPKILDYSDSYSFLYAPHQRTKGAWGWFARFEYQRIKKYEQQSAELFDRCVIASERDAQWLSTECSVPKDKLCVIPNGVDEQFFKNEWRESDVPTLVFSGNMSYYPNVDGIIFFARDILPAIRASIPDIRVLIVGARPTRRVQALANNHIVVTGYVKDMSEYIRRGHIAIAPLLSASGVQNKILEALALGIPVVATEVACNGLGYMTPEDGILTASPQSMAAVIIDVLHNVQKRKSLGQAARAYAKKNFLWSQQGERLKDCLNI